MLCGDMILLKIKNVKSFFKNEKDFFARNSSSKPLDKAALCCYNKTH